MKLCIFADIHGNRTAFSAFVNCLREEAVDGSVFLGDVCGYYFDEIEIIEELQTIEGLVAVRGNHDDLYLRAGQGVKKIRQEYLGRFGPALEAFLGREDGEARRKALTWLSSLPDRFVDKETGLACFHGSPWDPLGEYIYPDSNWDRFKGLEESVVCLGHTHHPMVIRFGEKMIINPGSIGQPRDGGPPTYAVIDLERRTAELCAVPFDSTEFVQEIASRSAGYPYLTEVFSRIQGHD